MKVQGPESILEKKKTFSLNYQGGPLFIDFEVPKCQTSKKDGVRCLTVHMENFALDVSTRVKYWAPSQTWVTLHRTLELTSDIEWYQMFKVSVDKSPLAC